MLTERNTCRNAAWLKGVACVAVAGAVLAAAPAQADPHVCGPACKQVWVPPVIEKQACTVEIPPVFEDVARQVWREPVYEERRVMVEIPAEVIVKPMPRYDRYGRLIGYDSVPVVRQPARKVWKTERVLVRPGGWETVVERVCVEPARTEVVYKDVEVRPGHWTTICDNYSDRIVGHPADAWSGRKPIVTGRPESGFGFGIGWREQGGGGTGFGIGFGWRNDEGRGGANFGWRDQGGGGGTVYGDRVGNGRSGWTPVRESIAGRFDDGRVRVSGEASRERR